MNYYELIYLKKELKHKLTDCVLELAITPHKNVLEFFITGKDKSSRLIFSTSPGNIALFADTYRPAKKSNALEFFGSVYGEIISDVVLAEQDRLFALEFENTDRLWFRMFSAKANALLVKDGFVVESFKDQNEVGRAEPSPKQQKLFTIPEGNPKAKRVLISANPMIPRSHLSELVEANDLEDKPGREIVEFAKEITDQVKESAVFRKLELGDVTLINEQYLPLKTEKIFKSVNDLIAYRYKSYSYNQRLKQQKAEIEKAINRQIKRLKSALSNLEKADEGLQKAGQYEKMGHLLMANAHLKYPEEKKLKVPDLYEDGKEIIIDVDTSKTIAENAEHYYQRSANSEQSYHEAKERTPELKARKKKLERMQDEISEINQLWDIEDWKKEHKKELAEIGVGSKQEKESVKPPFHLMEIEGYQVWIGRNARNNDELVREAHKEDVWMHARGVPGSHLIIRMENNKNMPDKRILRQAAAYAAYNSKAKGSKLVPVIITKLKYVRKPKGAAPGAVIVQKEEVEIVEPEKPTL